MDAEFSPWVNRRTYPCFSAGRSRSASRQKKEHLSPVPQIFIIRLTKYFKMNQRPSTQYGRQFQPTLAADRPTIQKGQRSPTNQLWFRTRLRILIRQSRRIQNWNPLHLKNFSEIDALRCFACKVLIDLPNLRAWWICNESLLTLSATSYEFYWSGSGGSKKFLFICCCFFFYLNCLFTVDIKVASSKRTKWLGFSYKCWARAESKSSFLLSNLRDLSIEFFLFMQTFP